MPPYLFQLLEKLSDGSVSQYPVRKVFFKNLILSQLALVISKIISLIVGDDQSLENLKKEHGGITRTSDGGPHFVKTSVQDYSDYRHLIRHRYPSYYFPEPVLGSVRLPIPQKQLDQVYSKFYEWAPVDLNRESIQNYLEAARYSVFEPPLEDKQFEPPVSIVEADSTYQKYLWGIVYHDQMEKAKAHVDAKYEYGDLADKNARFRRIKRLYTTLGPTMAGHMSMLIRLLFYLNVSPSSDVYSNDHGRDDIHLFPEHEKLAEILRRDGVRHKEIITNAISQIILDLLKSSKRFRKRYFT
jgi:hypothetical protein